MSSLRKLWETFVKKMQPVFGPAGVDLIMIERDRQIQSEGWRAEHDDEHIMGELASAAMCYAHTAVCQEIKDADLDDFAGEWWPWTNQHWKPSSDQVRNLVKAGALIAAEIDRIQRRRARGLDGKVRSTSK